MGHIDRPDELNVDDSISLERSNKERRPANSFFFGVKCQISFKLKRITVLLIKGCCFGTLRAAARKQKHSTVDMLATEV